MNEVHHEGNQSAVFSHEIAQNMQFLQLAQADVDDAWNSIASAHELPRLDKIKLILLAEHRFIDQALKPFEIIADDKARSLLEETRRQVQEATALDTRESCSKAVEFFETKASLLQTQYQSYRDDARHLLAARTYQRVIAAQRCVEAIKEHALFLES